MSVVSARLGLPFLQPAQAQKHVTHNEALLRLDALVQTGITEYSAATPPTNPTEGALYALGPAPTGDWAGQAGRLALYQDGLWAFLEPQPGWRAWDLTDSRLMVFEDGAWAPVEPDLSQIDGIGIGAAWDSVNRLTVASDASLLTHSGTGHQLKINKAASGDTASLLFQSNWAGHAEMGLAGSNSFSVKVSADGAAWTEALTFDPATGTVSGAAVQAAPDDITQGRLMRADWGYGPGTLLGGVSESGGVPTGAVIEQGSNANGSYTRWADGTQICRFTGIAFDFASSDVDNVWWTYPAAFATAPDFVSATPSLVSADWSASGSRSKIAAIGPQTAPGSLSVKLALYMSTTTTTTIANCCAFAVGRWF